MKKFVITIIALAVCSLSFAADSAAPSVNPQQQADAASAQNRAVQAALRSPFATSACSFTFTSGTNDTFLKYCVTANGNITQLETPQGHEHIAVGAFGEGYGLCDATVGSAQVPYFDYADPWRYRQLAPRHCCDSEPNIGENCSFHRGWHLDAHPKHNPGGRNFSLR